ncbi:MAG: porin family protein [Bradyrhizobium sp.]|nr:porin family protein [Bradyrhizobium sp.]
MRIVAGSFLGIAILLAATAANAADIPIKARPMPVVVPGWTGLYVGVQGGGTFADRTARYIGNDPASTLLIDGTIPGATGEQPVLPHGYRTSGATGGVEAGYNWQVSPNWLLGVEADFSAGGPRGRGNGTTALLSVPPDTLPQTVTSDQRIDWWGTVRGRFGALATPDLLLFGSAGLAYGRVSSSDRYGFTAPIAAAATIAVDFGGSSFSCTENTTCFTGSGASVKTGWTAGGGGEWRFASHWTFKAEYLYVDLGRDQVRSNALAVAALLVPGAPASYTADLGRTYFHVVRAGVNYQF